MTTYFGFALADSMFSGNCTISRAVLSAEDARFVMQTNVITSCLNPSHQATIEAARARFGIDVEVPEKPPQVSLKPGDSLIVMGVRGLPRLTDRHEYTSTEIENATFAFSIYYVQA